jgi:hypothetical protein
LRAVDFVAVAGFLTADFLFAAFVAVDAFGPVTLIVRLTGDLAVLCLVSGLIKSAASGLTFSTQSAAVLRPASVNFVTRSITPSMMLSLFLLLRLAIIFSFLCLTGSTPYS